VAFAAAAVNAVGGGVAVSQASNHAGGSSTTMAAQGPGSGAPTDMAATLAKKLGVSQSKVEAAMQSMRPSGAGKPPSAS
jgi:hypothetical protein